ncbi:MAG: YidC/Oxa1 family rane protein insertase [Chloroflexia bacterium]|jgi:YidC/Oxa1 family membrane protein insertase|nr:YidC/Oxa1 family rane protein insertase [Chloroflexia bacterium]
MERTLLEIFGFLWGSFWHLLLNVLVAINSVVPNAGISIIIFTLMMRLLTVPLTMRALKSSRNMQQIQPLIKEVQKKYGKDRQKQQEELMKVYAEYGVNPAASCFPMLIQLPIFIGLYSALQFVLPVFHGTAAEIATATAAHTEQLKSILWNPAWIENAANFGQAFLWVPNLAREDPLHIWPVLSGIFQFMQSRMAMPVRDPNQPQDPQTRMMQNMMQFMPIYIIFISWGFPTGTVIYWAFSSIFGAVQQYFITGFGTLPDLPGMGWLPRKPVQPPTPIRPRSETEGADGLPPLPAKRGLFSKMMDKALQAQEVQRAAQGAQGAQVTTGLEDRPRGAGSATRPTGNRNGSGSGNATTRSSSADGGEPTRRTSSVLRGGNVGRDAIENGSGGEQRGKGRGSVYGSSQPENGETPRRSARYASDVDLEEDTAGAGTSSNGASGPAQLPRKRKNKR